MSEKKNAKTTLNEELEKTMEMAEQASEIATTEEENTLPEFLSIRPMDYDREQKKAKEQAKKVMSSLLKFYLDEGFIEENKYVQYKAVIETSTLAGLMVQIKSAEHAITTLLKTIHSGNTSPRMFEVLATMQKTYLDLLKHQTLHMVASEETMKKVKRDLGEISGESKKITAGEGTLRRGTRDLMRELGDEEENVDFGDDEDEFDT